MENHAGSAHEKTRLAGGYQDGILRQTSMISFSFLA